MFQQIQQTTFPFITHTRVRRGRDRMELDIQLPMQSVPITTDVAGSTPAQGEGYNIM